LAALAQDNRLDVFRLLVQAGQQRWPEEGPELNQDLSGADQRDQLPR